MAIAGWGKVREESLKKALPLFPFQPPIENLSVVKGSLIFYHPLLLILLQVCCAPG